MNFCGSFFSFYYHPPSQRTLPLKRELDMFVNLDQTTDGAGTVNRAEYVIRAGPVDVYDYSGAGNYYQYDGVERIKRHI